MAMLNNQRVYENIGNRQSKANFGTSNIWKSSMSQRYTEKPQVFGFRL